MVSDRPRENFWKRIRPWHRLRSLLRAVWRLGRGDLELLQERSNELDRRLDRVSRELHDAVDTQAQIRERSIAELDDALRAQARRADDAERAGADLAADFAAQMASAEEARQRLEAELARHGERADEAMARLEQELLGRLGIFEKAKLPSRVEQLEKAKLPSRVEQLEKARLPSRVEQLEKAKLPSRVEQLEKAKLPSRVEQLEKAKLADRLETLEASEQSRHKERQQRQRKVDAELKKLHDRGEKMRKLFATRLASYAEKAEATGKRLAEQAGKRIDSLEAQLAGLEEKLAHQSQRQRDQTSTIERRLERHAQRADRIESTVETNLQRHRDRLDDISQRIKTLMATSNAVSDFDRTWAHLSRYVDLNDPTLEDRLEAARQNVHSTADAQERLLDVVCEDDVIHFRDASLRFISRRALWTVMRDILIEEEYFFKHPDAAPRIIDGGSNFGLSIYYFKHLYPEARITGFEPAADLFELAKENVARNQWRDVEMLPYALGAKDGSEVFYHPAEDRLAGSLTRRKEQFGETLEACEVECRRLSPYLDEPIDLLKLDIEGAERQVLPEIQDRLALVRHVVCEFHVDPAMDPEQLGESIQVLERAGFRVHLGKADAFVRSTLWRPMSAVERPVSLVIWAKNRRDPAEPEPDGAGDVGSNAKSKSKRKTGKARAGKASTRRK